MQSHRLNASSPSFVPSCDERVNESSQREFVRNLKPHFTSISELFRGQQTTEKRKVQ